jgi:hypothetical protein
MSRSFKNLRLPRKLTKDPRVIARSILGALLLANLLAAFAIFQPLGGSAEQLDQELGDMQQQLQREQTQVQRMRSIESKIQHARTTGDSFLTTYFMDRRTASSSIVSELNRAAKEAGMTTKEHSFSFDALEGSDTLSMMTVVGNYEGTYSDLLQLVNRLDKSSRFLIIDTMTATPLAGSGKLAISIKLNTFVREDGPIA